MRAGLLGACAAVLVGGCGGTRPAAPPAPVAGTEPAPVTAVPGGPLRYRLRGPVVYALERYDSLFYASMPGAPQGTAKRAILVVRALPGRNNELEVRIDSLVALEDTRLTKAAIDSSLGNRWQITLGGEGATKPMTGGHTTILSGQIEALVRLLFPQLPSDGLRLGKTWSDSSGYRLQLDAFDAVESAARTSQAVPGGATTSADGGLTVEAIERLSRTGTATQGGQTLTLKGAGIRHLRYEFSVEGWVSMITARDSLDLVVTIGQGGETVPVRWRSTLIGRLRDVPLR